MNASKHYTRLNFNFGGVTAAALGPSTLHCSVGRDDGRPGKWPRERELKTPRCMRTQAITTMVSIGTITRPKSKCETNLSLEFFFKKMNAKVCFCLPFYLNITRVIANVSEGQIFEANPAVAFGVLLACQFKRYHRKHVGPSQY